MAPAAAALFAPDGEEFAAAAHARGPWDERMMHGGAPAALLAGTIEATEPGDELVVTRLTIEFLSGVPLGSVRVTSQLARPGRRFQVVDATLDAGGRHACLARATRVRRADLPGAAASPAGEVGLPASPDEGEIMTPFSQDSSEQFHPDACEIRRVGGEFGSGAVAAWIRLRCPVVTGQSPSQLQRTAAAADFTNGLSWIVSFDDWLFVNTELTVHLAREPEGEWIGVDARSSISPAGFGLSTAGLHDRHGPFGACAQSLFVQPR
ncbi:MAG: thioesterase family protein [Solirubrobacteraceae bacterium]